MKIIKVLFVLLISCSSHEIGKDDQCFEGYTPVTLEKILYDSIIEENLLKPEVDDAVDVLGAIPHLPPVDGFITSGFGFRRSPFTGQKVMHWGIDIAANIGAPIFAPSSGTVEFVGHMDGYGNLITISHGYDIESRFGHTDKMFVVPGQRVLKGDAIGTVGMTGNTTGPHLHYEISINGYTKNPQSYLDLNAKH